MIYEDAPEEEQPTCPACKAQFPKLRTNGLMECRECRETWTDGPVVKGSK